MSEPTEPGEGYSRGPLSIPCPACKRPAGERCHTVLGGLDVGWTHDARHDAHAAWKQGRQG